MSKFADVSLGGGDPRLSVSEGEMGGTGIVAYTRPQMRLLHDPSVALDEYMYYAQKTRAEEQSRIVEPSDERGFLSTIFPSKSGKGATPQQVEEKRRDSKVPDVNISDPANRAQVTDDEWTNASRATRTATTGAIFYLITTDILGPFALPYAFSSVGWGPGVVLYTIFGFLAGVSGWLMWQCFMAVDSYEYPIKHYGDLAFRIMGRPMRYIFNILQSLQLVCSVGLIVISNGEALSEAANFKLCYAICCLVWALAGFIIGQIRTLQKFGWLANFAVWINLLIIFLTMGFASHSEPLYSAGATAAGGSIGDGSSVEQLPDGSYPPVMHSGGLPDPSDFGAAVNGLMQAVYSYGGAFLFAEFMSEMKRPRDFLKAMWGAQLFIYVVYMLYGLFMYAYEGQYTQQPSYLGIAPYSWQTAGNALAIVSALIAAGLYGNIGVKVLYNNIAVELFKAPPLTQRGGKIAWAFFIPVYWAIAYIIAAAIPDFAGFVSVVSASCILQFTYTFPPILHLAYAIQKGAMREGEGFDPATGQITRHDSGPKRWARGFCSGMWYLNCWNVIYFLGALVTAGLGMYAAIENLIEAYAKPQLNAFSCTSPYQPS